MEPDLLQDILCFVILAHIAVDETNERMLISADERFKSFLITGTCETDQDVV